MQVRHSHLSAESTIGDVIAHPAFAGFGRLILPWDNRNADGNMHLREISALLPYHSEANPTDVVTSLNRMIDDSSDGKTIFYDFYTEAQKKAEPTNLKRTPDTLCFSRMTQRPLSSPLNRLFTTLDLNQEIVLLFTRFEIATGDATSATYEVGHESVSHFNREYSRMIGQPPVRDIKAPRNSMVVAMVAIDAA